MRGFVFESCIWASLPQAPTLPLKVVPTETSTPFLLPPLPLFFQCLLCASGLFKLIQTLPWRFACFLACLLGLLAFPSTPAMSLFTGYRRAWKKEGLGAEKKTLPKQKPLFHYANNMLCCLHRTHPTVADLLILRWDKTTPWLHWLMSFSFHTRFYATPGFTFL